MMVPGGTTGLATNIVASAIKNNLVQDTVFHTANFPSPSCCERNWRQAGKLVSAVGSTVTFSPTSSLGVIRHER